MKKILIVAIFIMALSGCVNLDRNYHTKFEPIITKDGPQQFKYFALANMIYLPDSKEDEDIRMQWLQTWLTANNMCKNGYEITERKAVSTGALSDSVKHIYYTGQCK